MRWCVLPIVLVAAGCGTDLVDRVYVYTHLEEICAPLSSAEIAELYDLVRDAKASGLTSVEAYHRMMEFCPFVPCNDTDDPEQCFPSPCVYCGSQIINRLFYPSD